MMTSRIHDAPDAGNGYQAEHAAMLIHSYRRWTGRDLLGTAVDGDAARALYEAPFAVVSHGTEEDPVFNYGNRTALDLFEMDWSAFTRLPSRQSAEPVNRAARAAFMARVTRDGCVEDYRGVRISSTGRRFMIEEATVWNLAGDDGTYRGQAAAIFRWSEMDAAP